jgi:hypothetical protein
MVDHMTGAEFRREFLVDTLRLEMLKQLGRCGMDGGGSVGVDSNAGYDGEATINCYKLADAVLNALTIDQEEAA